MRPIVQLTGDVDHADFRDAIALLRKQAHLVDAGAGVAPELIVIAQSRPGAVAGREVEQLQRIAPLAGVVALLGSWCEGETRTGRPWPGVARQYWYEFPAWWRRQIALHSAGRCPDWARPGDCGLRIADCGLGKATIRNRTNGLIVIRAISRETRDVLTDVLRGAAYATVWHRIGLPDCEVRGAAAGIWDGGQLDEAEANDLANFCRTLIRDGAPVIAVLDFPRHDSVQRAIALGASAVLGKPWRHEALILALQDANSDTVMVRAA